MLFIGLILLTTGFIIIYKGTFAIKYLVPNSVFSFIASIIVMSLDKLEHKILSLIVLFIIILSLHYNLKSMFINPKATYIIFNMKTSDLMDVLGEILLKQNIYCHITNNFILLDSSDDEIIEVKHKILGLNILSLSDIASADLLTLIENKLDITLNQMPHKKIPLFGTIVFAIGLIITLLFYISFGQ